MKNPVGEMLDNLAWSYVLMYYWPYFLAGNMDNIKDVIMCRVTKPKNKRPPNFGSSL